MSENLNLMENFQLRSGIKTLTEIRKQRLIAEIEKQGGREKTSAVFQDDLKNKEWLDQKKAEAQALLKKLGGKQLPTIAPAPLSPQMKAALDKAKLAAYKHDLAVAKDKLSKIPEPQSTSKEEDALRKIAATKWLSKQAQTNIDKQKEKDYGQNIDEADVPKQLPGRRPLTPKEMMKLSPEMRFQLMKARAAVAKMKQPYTKGGSITFHPATKLQPPPHPLGIEPAKSTWKPDEPLKLKPEHNKPLPPGIISNPRSYGDKIKDEPEDLLGEGEDNIKIDLSNKDLIDKVLQDIDPNLDYSQDDMYKIFARHSKEMNKNTEPETAMTEGMVPVVCSGCQKQVGEKEFGDKVKPGTITHTICGDCMKQMYGADFYNDVQKSLAADKEKKEKETKPETTGKVDEASNIVCPTCGNKLGERETTSGKEIKITCPSCIKSKSGTETYDKMFPKHEKDVKPEEDETLNEEIDRIFGL